MNIHFKSIMIVALLAAVGCGSPDDGRTTDGGTNGESATVQGALTSEASAESASEAELFVVGDDGSLESASRTDISAEGSYSFDLGVDGEADGEKTLVVKAYDEANAEIGSVVASRVVAANETIVLAPMDAESHTEARLVVEIRASGECDSCSVESTRAFITAEIAQEAAASEEEFDRIMAAFTANAEAQAEVMAESEADARQEIRASLDAALEARDESLATAETDTERDEALATFEEARVAAYLESSISIDVLARAFQAGSAAAEASATAESETSSGLNALWLHAEADAATFVGLKIDDHEFPNESSQTEVRAAGEKLVTDIEAVVATSAEIEAELESAWNEYAATIRAELTSEIEAATYTAIQQLQASLEAAHTTYAEAVASGESAASAQAELFAEVTAESNVQALSATGMTAAEAEAHLTILAHLMLEEELPDLEGI